MRSAGAGKLEKDMCGGLDALATQLGKQWGISCVLECVEDVPVSAAVRHHVHHLVREGVANAVRHGGATLVTLRLQAREAAVFLEIVDNGSGFAQVHRGESGREEEVIPQSLNDRVRQLGGNLELRSTSAGSYVRVSLPREARL
jgi:signal transduction histidine kinase